MAVTTDNFKPLSLVQYFDPPDKHIGTFGWACGYSAGADFLNLALERFTGRTKPVRARDGIISLIIMLDKSNPQIPMNLVPGIFHAGRDGKKLLPFRLLHAKLALLHFKNIENPSKSHLRLLVSTGNWTSQTLSESLDLVCSIDLNSDDFNSCKADKKQIRTDLIAAWSLIQELRNFFPHSIVNANKDKETYIYYHSFESILNSIPKPRDGVSRLLDNRSNSLLEQLPDLINKSGKKLARNYIALGSGFFQKPHSSGQVPTVIQRIFTSLHKSDLVTKNPEKELFVNPDSCQGVAKSVAELKKNDWTIRKAIDPLNAKRALHAKFVFSANQRSGSNSCSNAWLYIGSGNLTEAGFTSKMSPIAGNIEVGIVLFPGKLYWRHEKKIKPAECVNKLLPMDWGEDSLVNLGEDLSTGEEMPDKIQDFVAAPISWFKWIEREGEGLLQPGEECHTEYQVYKQKDEVCIKDVDGNWVFGKDQPSVVDVRWGYEFKFSSLVPVIDLFGRIAGKKLSKIQLEEVWWQLEAFPDFTGNEDDEESLDLPDYEFDKESDLKKQRSRTGSYSIRKMMELVENIADKQTAVTFADWKVWCNRLEQCLAQTIESEEYTIFRAMNINPLSPLRNESFRPSYAVDNLTEEGKYYETVLNRIEDCLKLSNLGSL
ncbi:MAG: hypothetical protein ABIU63_15175 [Chitinophagaceae bacterium]